MVRGIAIAVALAFVGLLAPRGGAATIYAQTGFNDQSGINSDATVGSPYAIGQTINGRVNGETGWSQSSWKTLDGGGSGGDTFAVVSSTAPFEGDGVLAVTAGSRGSTQFTRDFGNRTDHFVVETEANFGSVGDFEGQVIQDNYPLSANVNGPSWRLTGNVGSRHFEVFNGTHDNGGAWESTGIAQTPGQWQDAVADINVVTQTWTFSVDGVAYNKTLGFQGTPPQLNGLYYFDSAAGSVDSIIVRSTPEPGGALVFLAALGAGALRRGRRRN